MKNISIVILNWNGKWLLDKFLPSVLRAARFYNTETQIIIVDDGSSDGTKDFLRTYYPKIDLLDLEKNKGFYFAANRGIAISKNDLVVLLNNDVEPREDFLQFLPAHFDDPEVFALRIKSIIVEDNKIDPIESWVGGEFRFGFIYGLNEKEYKIKDGLSFSAGGGAVALDKKKFMQLGGFDSILSPFYWEDVDLSYRAWKRGWKIIYEPRSMLYHYHRSTISKAFNPNYIAFIGERNRYLVVWKNIFDCGFLLQYILFIPLRLARNLFKGKLVLVFAFFAALGRFRIVLKRREIEKQEAKRTDKEIFALFNPKNKTEKGIFKVLYIDEWGDIHGGGQIYSLSLLKKIDRNKFIPVFVCPSPGTFVDALEEEGVKVEIIKMKSLRNPLNILSFISSTIKITALIKKEKVDFIYSSGAARGTIYAGIAAKIMKIPLIWHVHILNSTGLLNRILACLSTKIIIIAEAGHKRFSWVHDPTKVVTNYNGIDLQKFNPNNIDNMSIKREFGLSPDIILVGTVGILHPQKGQKYLLEIVKQIKAEISDIKFLIVGNDPTKDARHRRELESLTRELGIAKDVIFTGWRQDIPKIMAGLDIFVLPSLVDHLPLVVLEAMASGKPVVATNVGGVFEMVEDRVTGILVPPGDSESLRRAIIGLLKDKEKAKRMGMAGRRRTEEFFNIEANAKIIEQVYRDLLGKTP